jgi:hypothetical protein
VLAGKRTLGVSKVADCSHADVIVNDIIPPIIPKIVGYAPYCQARLYKTGGRYIFTPMLVIGYELKKSK